jgi:hypothetical protein
VPLADLHQAPAVDSEAQMRPTALIGPVVPVVALLGILLAAGCGSLRPAGAGSSSSGTSHAGKLVLAPQRGAQGAVAGAPAMFPLRPTSYVLDGTLPSLGAEAPVRRMVPHAVGSADVRRWASALGLAGTPTPITNGYQVAATDGVLTVTTVGGTTDVTYFRGGPAASGGSGGSVGVSSGSAAGGAPIPSKPDAPPTLPVPAAMPPPVPAPVDVPNAHAAEAIARVLLDRVGALDGQRWTATVSAGGGVAVACAVGVRCPWIPAEVSSRIVTFGLVIDGVSVTGMNWSVTVGSHGRIDAVNGEWDSPVLVGSYPLRSTKAVFADLQRARAIFVGPQPAVGYAAPAPGLRSGTITSPAPLPALKVHITGVAIGIARWAGFDNGRGVVDLVPTYRFRARATGGDSNGAAANDIEVLALDTGAVDFTSPTPKPLPPVQPAIAPAPAPGQASSGRR